MCRVRPFIVVALISIVGLLCVLPPSASVQQREPTRKFDDDIFTPVSSAFGKGSTNSTPAAIASLTPNDPGYDPTWGNVLDMPSMLGELQQRMSAGLNPQQTVYIAIMDSTIMSHP